MQHKDDLLEHGQVLRSNEQLLHQMEQQLLLCQQQAKAGKHHVAPGAASAARTLPVTCGSCCQQDHLDISVSGYQLHPALLGQLSCLGKPQGVSSRPYSPSSPQGPKVIHLKLHVQEEQ